MRDLASLAQSIECTQHARSACAWWSESFQTMAAGCCTHHGFSLLSLPLLFLSHRKGQWGEQGAVLCRPLRRMPLDLLSYKVCLLSPIYIVLYSIFYLNILILMSSRESIYSADVRKCIRPLELSMLLYITYQVYSYPSPFHFMHWEYVFAKK